MKLFRLIFLGLFSILSLINVKATSVLHTIPFMKVEGLMLVEANVDNQSGYMVFDTGSDAILINREGEVPSEKNSAFHTLNGAVGASRISVENLQIGDYNLDQIEAYQCDLSGIVKYANKKVIGILGTKYFQSYVLHIDNVNNVIQLLKRNFVNELAKRPSIKSSLSIENGILVLPVSIDGEYFRFGLDTGASGSVISDRIVNSHPSFFNKLDFSIDMLTANTNQLERREVISISSISISNLLVKDLQLSVCSFKELNAQLDTSIDGILSLDQISVNDIFIDFLNKEVLVSL